ncbi:MAG: 3D domain-containing protein, partial [Firmicutes bacterium]|nr:3D domain-containing protein [Bacillota bacterium]
MLPRYITYGTKNAPGSITVEATGYTAGPESTGKKPGDPGYGITATGTKAKRGTVAVDPSVIPFGTKMFIPGYGYGIAEDTGGAIKGNKIDLFFDSVEEAMAWGRRMVTVRLFTGEKSQASVAILSWGKTDIGWPLEKDEKLFEKYLELDNGWLNKFQSRGELLNSKVAHASGNAASPDALVKEIWDPTDVPAEKDQVSNHRVHWALLASLDRVLGDPIIHGEHGLETEGRGRKPDPEGHFKELEPEFEWETFELYYYHRWTVKSKDKDGNTITKTYTEEYRHPVKLLKKAQTYEANYAYFWKEKVTEHSSDDSYTKITVPELQMVERRGPYYEKLIALLNRFGLARLSNAEFVLQLAANFDDSFLIAGNLTSSFLEVSGSTENVAFSGGSGVMVRPVSGPLTSRFGY